MTDLSLGVPRTDTERVVRSAFPRQVETCEEALRLGRNLTVDVGPGRKLTGVDGLIALEAARGLKTYRASVDLALGGYGPQAEMLNRALFEGMAVAHWVHANPEEALRRFSQHERHHAGLWNKRFVARGLIDEPGFVVPDETEQKRLDKLFGEWGEKPWFGLSLYSLVRAVEDQFANPDELRTFFSIAHSANNEALHTGYCALMSGVTNTETESHVAAGPGLEHVETALFGGWWSCMHLLGLYAGHFNLAGGGRVADEFTSGAKGFIRIEPAVARRTGRNDPCPCGSGGQEVP
jgi:hypothetical protein